MDSKSAKRAGKSVQEKGVRKNLVTNQCRFTKEDVTKAEPFPVFFKPLNRSVIEYDQSNHQIKSQKRNEILQLKGNFNELMHIINNRRSG